MSTTETENTNIIQNYQILTNETPCELKNLSYAMLNLAFTTLELAKDLK